MSRFNGHFFFFTPNFCESNLNINEKKQHNSFDRKPTNKNVIKAAKYLVWKNEKKREKTVWQQSWHFFFWKSKRMEGNNSSWQMREDNLQFIDVEILCRFFFFSFFFFWKKCVIEWQRCFVTYICWVRVVSDNSNREWSRIGRGGKTNDLKSHVLITNRIEKSRTRLTVTQYHWSPNYLDSLLLSTHRSYNTVTHTHLHTYIYKWRNKPNCKFTYEA